MRKFIFTTVLLFVVMLTFGTIPNSGLIGYWPFSGNANDASGHGHNGIVANATLTTDKDNKANSAYSFSGNSTITIPNHKDFDFSKIKQYSYGCWIYNNTSGNQVYMGKDAPGCQNISFNIQQESTGIFTTGMHGSSCWNTYTSNKSLGVNQWHHVLVSVDSLSLSIYIDGKFINKNQMIIPMWGDYVSDIVFGAWPSYHGNERFVSGKIDEVVLYNRAISASEVSTIYNDTKPQIAQIPTSGLIGYWPFNGNANDESGRGHNGIVTNATLTTDMNNKAGSAYYFNGNGSITIPYHKDFDFSKCKQYSYGCWINNSASGVQAYIGKDAPSCQNNSFNFQEYYDGKLVNAMHGSDCWNVYPTNVSLGINQWHHVLVSTDSLSTSIYIDGALIRKDQMKAPMWGDYARSIVFGAWPSVSGNERFVRGKIDDVVIYNRALTANEVRTIYNIRPCSVPVTVSDTTVIKVCDSKFQTLSPQLHYLRTDTIKSNVLCDSVITRYIKYQYATDCCPTTSSLESLTIKATTPVGTVTINVYPNPTKDHVKVECLDYAKIENYQVRLVSSTSMILWSAVINQSSFDVDMTTIPQGVYLIEVYDNQGNKVDFKKIIKL